MRFYLGKNVGALFYACAFLSSGLDFVWRHGAMRFSVCSFGYTLFILGMDLSLCGV